MTLEGLAAAWLEIAYVGLLSSAVTFTLLTVALQHTPPSEAAVIVSSHQLSEFQSLFSTLLILYRGQIIRFGRLSDLRNELAAEGRSETLEELFLRVTHAPERSTEALP